MRAPTAEERARTRAEARRRARLAARGGTLDGREDVEIAAPPPAGSRGNVLQRIFPSAPPLPNRPDPLARFNRTRPLAPVRERLFLLGVNPIAWMLPSLTVFVGYVADSMGSAGQLVGPFLTFGSLIAAGWVGWQRPGLYGVTSALVGLAIFVAVLLADFGSSGDDLSAIGGLGAIASSFIPYAVLQGAVGFLGGWYGGYLRRRQAQVGADARAAAARRRR